MNSRNNCKIFSLVIAGIMLLTGILGGGYYYFQIKELQKNNFQTPESSQSSSNKLQTEISTSDWKTYSNSERRYEFMYPNSWINNLDSTPYDLESPDYKNYLCGTDGCLEGARIMIKSTATTKSNVSDEYVYMTDFEKSPYTADGQIKPNSVIDSNYEISVSSEKAIEYSGVTYATAGPSSPFITTLVVYKGKTYQITLNYYYPKEDQRTKDFIAIYHRIISTYRFL